ncbi:MAG TPA: hypothetical protein VEY91_05925, partial [Candidatus Limnocylindria bacterium]|nr:hypothetical protein [Candidatus Limnocylindria bacterium]
KEVRRGARMRIPNTIPPQYRVDPPGRGWTGQPNYSRLPEVLQLRRELPNPDPLPPFRDQQSPSNFYQSSFGAEILADQLIGGGPNVIREDLNGSAPGGVESTLDTLYHYITPSNSGFQPIATYYHGLDNTPLVFMGFPLWFPKRAQAQQIVDFVLQDIWGIPADFVVGPQPARAVRSAATPGIRKPAAPGIGRGNASGGAATRTLNARRTPSPTSGRTPRIQK